MLAALAAFGWAFYKYLEKLDSYFNAIDTRFNAIDTCFNAVDKRMDSFEQRFDNVEVLLRQLQASMNKKWWCPRLTFLVECAARGREDAAVGGGRPATQPPGAGRQNAVHPTNKRRTTKGGIPP